VYYHPIFCKETSWGGIFWGSRTVRTFSLRLKDVPHNMIIELAQALRIKYKQQAVQVHLNMGGKPNARIIEPVIVEEGDTFDSIKMAIEKMKKYRAECDAKREQESEQ
jgi:hypothetical protein